jgi:predicted membrane-bound spermidine synthase
MIEFILVYLFIASCMAIAIQEANAAYSITNKTDWLGLLIVSLFWPWFLVASLFSMLIK